MRANGLLHPVVQFGLALPALEGCLRLAVVRVVRDQGAVAGDCGGEVAHAMLHLAEERARLSELRVERECSFELVPCISVATIERRGQSGAEMQASIFGIG